MDRKPSWGLVYGMIGLVLGLLAVIVAASLFGLSGAAAHRLIDAGLALAALLAFAWPSLARRGLMMEASDRSGAYGMRVYEPAPIPWLPQVAREQSEPVSEFTGTD